MKSRPRVGPLAGRPGPAPAMDVDALIDDRGIGIIVCCGSGGVGKTTTSAALALRAAERGRKVVVLTIDPARRLAQSMGIEALDNTPRPVTGVEGGPDGAYTEGGPRAGSLSHRKTAFRMRFRPRTECPMRARSLLHHKPRPAVRHRPRTERPPRHGIEPPLNPCQDCPDSAHRG